MTEMTGDKPFENGANADDLHQLMAIAVLCGHRGVPANVGPVYEAWARVYPDDALGPIGRGLTLVGGGRPREGYAMIEEAARRSTTRADQANDILRRLREDMAALVD